MKWTAEQIPDQDGRSVLITGANSGLGLETAKALAAKGASVTLACRSLDRAEAAAAEIRDEAPDADLDLLELDLASLDSTAAAANAYVANHGRLDLLINNAGVMALPRRKETADEFEMQLGVNHLGHFAFTGHLIDLITSTEGARIVTVASIAHRFGFINRFDLQLRFFYQPFVAYGQSKLANLLFTRELASRLKAAGADTLAVAAHPGVSNTNLARGPFGGDDAPNFLARAADSMTPLAQSAAMGALPSLYAAVASDVEGGDYIGPDGLLEQRGHPKKVGSSYLARDDQTAGWLWNESRNLTDVSFDL